MSGTWVLRIQPSSAAASPGSTSSVTSYRSMSPPLPESPAQMSQRPMQGRTSTPLVPIVEVVRQKDPIALLQGRQYSHASNAIERLGSPAVFAANPALVLIELRLVTS